MIAVSFDNLPGFLHPAAGDIGVVMCSAQGFEELCGRKDWRLLAGRIAALGVPVLRFDYAGTGDAPGSDADPARLQAWADSLRAAIRFMQREMGTSRIVLAGLRLGATLAALVAQDTPGIEGYIALNPVVSGRAYARELAVMAQVIAQVPGTAPLADGVEVAGFATTSATMAGIKTLDMPKLPHPPAPFVLLCLPQGGPATDKLARHWEELGSEVTCAGFPFYLDWMSDPTMTRHPAEAFASVIEWVGKTIVPRMAPRQNLPVAFPAPRIDGAGFIEEPVRIGADGEAFGILCSPRRAMSGAPTLVFANSGRNYHIGWGGSTLAMARQLAVEGIASLRIDVAGIGDSPDIAGRDPQVMYSAEPVSDFSAALDFLESRGLGRFCAVGLCSGAHLCFHSALRDDRIEQVMMVNLQKFIWRAGDSLEIAMRESYRSTNFYKRSLTRADTWKRLLRGEIRMGGIARAVLRRISRRVLDKAAMFGGSACNEGAQVRAGMHRLSERGTKVLLAYSDNDGGIDELALHFGGGDRWLAAYPGVQLKYITGADHNLTPPDARSQYAALLAGFVASQMVTPLAAPVPVAVELQADPGDTARMRAA